LKNDECIIYIKTKHGSTQIFRKEKNGWAQTSSRGVVRPCTAEQVLSHILPPLAGISPATVTVEPEKEAKENGRT
jgi:hypothetical protein